MKKFKLNRLEKKKLSKQFWLYPRSEDGTSRMAFPARKEEDYLAMKQVVLRSIGDESSTEKTERKLERQELDAEVFVSDQELRNIVNDVYASDYRSSSYETLIRAKKHKGTQVFYFNFINAYNKSKTKDSFLNVCCLATDFAKEKLKKYKTPKGKKSRKGYK
ncbi:hypothetical protein SAMN05660477_02266 [Soonwooa buanensis]|uniref:Uncharacterized protein n=1 Tax=Soonwooa buanensis TaxID=619805 RepID=A0A1T5FTR0_9FLAO|nr:hypothetical protein [Soonwooa buanensis]SKB99542.1 hypothetical protein SAMN05660477_02266 [Soonwooa buanensis]